MLMLAAVASEDLELHWINVVTAFPNGDLFEDIETEQHVGFVAQVKPAHVCKFQNALCGLRQAPRQSLLKIDTYLSQEHHFQSCAGFADFYMLQKDGKVMVVCFYVDDPLIAENTF